MYLTPEEHLVLGGEIKTGANVNLALFDKAGVLGASKELITPMLKKYPDAAFAIVASCEMRHIMLGAEMADGEKTLQNVCGDMPFMLCYAGAEFCPIEDDDSDYVHSRLMNQSLCICIIS
jgi:hypothetical protein